MKMLICSIRDASVGAFLQPFFQRSKGEAIRNFSDLVADPKTLFGKHPGDYTLFVLGAFDDNSGDVVPASTLEKLINGVECNVQPVGNA